MVFKSVLFSAFVIMCANCSFAQTDEEEVVVKESLEEGLEKEEIEEEFIEYKAEAPQSVEDSEIDRFEDEFIVEEEEFFEESYAEEEYMDESDSLLLEEEYEETFK